MNASHRLLLSGGQVFDGTGAPPERADVVVADGRIVAVGTGLDGDTGIDLSGHTICPGMIDCHVHVAMSHIDIWRYLQDPASLAYYQTARNLGRLLDAGITTARDAAGADLGTKQAVATGLVRGPRLLIAVTLISQTGGHSDGLLPSGCSLTSVGDLPGVPNPIADGIEGLRLKVREVVRAGADWVKIATSGGVLSPNDDPRHAHYTQEEVNAAVDEATRMGRCVMAHAQATDGIKTAVRAGARSIEHGIFLDEEAIALMLQRGTYLVPTLLALMSIRDSYSSPGMLAAAVEKAESVMTAQRASFRAAIEAGVRVAMGTDAVGYPHGRNLEELGLMVGEGMPTYRALSAATGAAAELLGLGDEVGTVAEGKIADLVAFEGELTPTSDLMDLDARLRLVFRSGTIVADRRPVVVGSPPHSVGSQPGGSSR
jgi:imidazolonepropionase-like amidohydrolase